jgi:hypothetical protein
MVALMRHLRGLVISLLVLSPACSKTAPQTLVGFPAPISGGTRLAQRTWVAADGTRFPDRDNEGRHIWFDRQQGFPCTFQSTLDGKVVCFPIATYGDPALNFLPVRGYSDDQCTNRIAFGPYLADGSAFQASRDAYCGGKSYATAINVRSDGPATYPIYATGAPSTVTTWYQQQLDAADCLPSPATGSATIVPLGPQVQPGDLVTGHIERVATGHRLSYQQIVADDGTRERVAWFDTATNLECTVQPAIKNGLPADGPASCVPKAAQGFLIGLYGDAKCTKELLAIVDAEVPAFVQSQDAYFRVGAPSPTLYGKDMNGTCAVTTQVGGVFYFAEKIPVAALDVFAEVVDLSPAAARLGVSARADADGATDTVASTLTDRMTGNACTFAATSDGMTRCLPRTVQLRYADNGCAGPPFVTLAPADDAGRLYAAGWKGDLCTGGATVYQLGSPIAPPNEVYDTDAQAHGCQRNPFASMLGSSGLAFRAVGDPVVASFLEATLVAE